MSRLRKQLLKLPFVSLYLLLESVRKLSCVTLCSRDRYRWTSFRTPRQQSTLGHVVRSRSFLPLRIANLTCLFESASHSDEAFKQVVHTAPHGKRDYYFNIRQAIQNKRNRSNPPIERFWLYSLRDDRSVLMSFFENV